VNAENEEEELNFSEITPVAVAGFRFFTPYMFHLDVRVDNQLRPQVGIERELMIFPRTVLFSELEYQVDFGWVNDLTDEVSGEPANFKDELVWSAGLEYFLGRNFSLKASYDNRFGVGGGLFVRF
jgi:hypothetical protein